MSLSFCEICDAIKDLHAKKNAAYGDHNVIDELPEDVWRAQIAIKGMRLYRSSNTQKQVDESLDSIVYNIMWLEKQSKAGVDIRPILGMGVNDNTSPQTIEDNPGDAL